MVNFVAISSREAQVTPPKVLILLEHYSKVFGEPSSLPPHKTYDHRVPLFPSA
uniref:Uncharacterized protein n=1 Tax=Rhizophora mucronata TaxID=61149 RepID=A0A2P2QLL6_RHIMU